MSHSEMLEKIREEQREEEMNKTPGERIVLACELSDTCLLLHQSARLALEKKRAAQKT